MMGLKEASAKLASQTRREPLAGLTEWARYPRLSKPNILSVIPLGSFRFKVSSPVDGYLIVLDVNAKNEDRQIFPNSFYGFELKAAELVGDSLLLTIVTEDPVELGDLLNISKDLQVIYNSNAYLAELAMCLRETWHQDEHNCQLRWSLVEKPYHIFR